MIAVADDDEVVTAFIGEAQNGLGRVAVARFAADGNAVLRGGVFDFLPAFLEVFVRRFLRLFRFAGQVGVARERFAHPQRGDFGLGFAGNGGSLPQRGLAALGTVITDQ